MKIFMLDEDPDKLAEMLDDKSLDKQIKAIAQVLCQIHLQWIDYNAHNFGDANFFADKIPLKSEKIGGFA